MDVEPWVNDTIRKLAESLALSGDALTYLRLEQAIAAELQPEPSPPQLKAAVSKVFTVRQKMLLHWLNVDGSWFQQVHNELHGKFTKRLQYQLADKDSVEDALQEFWLNLAMATPEQQQKLRDADATDGERWLRQAAKWQVLEQARAARAARRSFVTFDSELSEGDHLSDCESDTSQSTTVVEQQPVEVLMLFSLLAAANIEQRQCFLLHHPEFGDLSFADTATITGLAEGSVRTKFYALKDQLVTQLQEAVAAPVSLADSPAQRQWLQQRAWHNIWCKVSDLAGSIGRLSATQRVPLRNVLRARHAVVTMQNLPVAVQEAIDSGLLTRYSAFTQPSRLVTALILCDTVIKLDFLKKPARKVAKLVALLKADDFDDVVPETLHNASIGSSRNNSKLMYALIANERLSDDQLSHYIDDTVNQLAPQEVRLIDCISSMPEQQREALLLWTLCDSSMETLLHVSGQSFEQFLQHWNSAADMLSVENNH